MGRDRFGELQAGMDPAPEQTAIELGEYAGTHIGTNTTEGQFFYLMDTAKDQIEAVNQRIQQIAHLHDQALEATSEDEAPTDFIKQNLDVLQRTFDDPALSKSQRVARAAQQQAVARHFSELLQRYRQMETQYSNRNKERLERQYRIARPDATDEEIAAAIESDQAGQVFAQSVMHSSRIGEARRVLRDVEERQADIRKIEKTVNELSEMFLEVNDMVNRQQEMIDSIENAVEDTHVHVEDAHKEVKKAIVYRIKARKKMWIIIFLVILIIVIIIIIVYFTVIKK
ncbi:t-SNARE [Linderina pennispora]|uniref:t-SNARE n=1 Tax=Linderina pennispora TaxID=61395 RepID=A0A1Y1W529_9FUNG|nr:t-SNARE [Linderina pennispora]ORX68631.1 t-SNARE [Linderina pennispora]